MADRTALGRCTRLAGAKAWLMGRATVAAVRFEADPPPDYVEPLSPANGAIETPNA